MTGRKVFIATVEIWTAAFLWYVLGFCFVMVMAARYVHLKGLCPACEFLGRMPSVFT